MVFVDKELKSKYNKAYYAKHKVYVYEHLKQLRHCDVCNRDYCLYMMSKHRKTDKHINNSKINNNDKHIKSIDINNNINNNVEKSKNTNSGI